MEIPLSDAEYAQMAVDSLRMRVEKLDEKVAELDRATALIPPTLRDYFAGEALAGANLVLTGRYIEDSAEIASNAYKIADAMLVERMKEKP